MTAPVREIELKFLLARGDVDALLDALPPGETAVKAMTAVYYDTADGWLGRHGFGLRVRRTGDKRIQTLKSALGEDGGRDEWEWPAATDAPDPSLLATTSAALPAGAVLVARFTVSVSRTVRIVETDGARIEIALDDGEVQAGGRREAFLELELELLSGASQALGRLADQLRASVALTPSTVTKAERGFRLLDVT
jgi:triphosphatase